MTLPDPTARRLGIRTPAKVNLGLRVLSRRPDGYHTVRTLLAAVDLWDTLTFEPGGEGLRLECDSPSIPADQTNLVLRSASRLEDLLGRRLPGARIRLRKRIPAGRGLGGGSSNAAAALVGLNRLFGLGLSRRVLHQVLTGVGMDAPFFLYGGLALATGRGEHVFPLADVAELPLVLLIPEFGVSTPEAYRGLPKPPAVPRRENGPERADSLVRFLASGPSGPNSVASSSPDAFRTTSNGPPCCKRPGSRRHFADAERPQGGRSPGDGHVGERLGGVRRLCRPGAGGTRGLPPLGG